MNQAICRAALAAAFVLSSSGVVADNPLDEVVVVATRSPERLDKIGNSITVLDDSAIRASQYTLLSELLATTPGITISSNGGPGTNTSVFIRGADSDHTVILIDGVKLYNPSTVNGAIDWGNLLVGDISRIEILRGAQSTLYGSQAIGGVVNIITTEPPQGFGADIQAEAGSLDSRLAKTGIGGKFDQWSFRLAGTYDTTGSIPALDRRFGGTITDPFHDGVISGRATYDFTADVQADLRAYWTDGRVYYDGFPAPDYVLANDTQYETTRQFVSYGGLNFNLFEGQLKNRVAYEYTTMQRADYDDSGIPVTRTDSYKGNDSRFEYQGTWAIFPEYLPGYQAVFGLEQENSWSDATPDAPLHAETAQNSEYLQVLGDLRVLGDGLRGLTLTAGERHDHYDTFGEHYTGQLAAAWALPESTVLRASWAQGYKAPSLYQLYSPYGNQSLNPEQSTGGDVGVEQHLMDGRVTLSATYFLTNFRNLIEFENCPGSALCETLGQAGGYYANLDRARASGVELQASATLTPALSVSANYSHIKTVDETPGSPTYGQQAYDRPQDAANLAVSYTWPTRLTTTVSARFSAFSLEQNFNVYPVATVHLGGYTLLNARISYPLGDRLELYARVDNATNKWYETTYEYGTWGRTAFVGLRAKL
jgi:vitamin B12 transporter